MQTTTPAALTPADIRLDTVVSGIDAELVELELLDRAFDISGGYEFSDAERDARLAQMRELGEQIPALAVLTNR